MKKNLLLGLLLAAGTAFAQEPVLVNSNFSIIPKDSGSDCACAAWINKDLGDQAEGSSDIDGSGANDAIKFDNLEADLMYQEVAVLANTDYNFTYVYRVSGDETGTSELEIRILAGSGFTDGYEPSFPATAPEFSQRGYGYSDISDVENAANNLYSVAEGYPGNGDYNTKSFSFNTGDNTVIAILARGIGNPTTPPVDGKDYAWSAGDQETRIDSVSLTLAPEGQLSSDDVFAAGLSVYPNPASGIVTIDAGNAVLTSVQLFSTLGEQVYASDVTTSLNVSSLAKGVYFLKLNGEGASATKKLIVE